MAGVRLFVAVWPPADVVTRVAALPRPDVAGLRWTAPDHWHVTLRFLGSVPAAEPVAAPGTLLTRPGLVDVHGAAVQLTAIQRLDGFGCIVAAGHLDKREAARLAGVTVTHDADPFDRAVGGKCSLKLIFRGLVGKVSYENIGHLLLL